MRKPQECLNRKSEWGGSKIPGMTVETPKGVVAQNYGENERKKEGNSEGERVQEIMKEVARKGLKRVRYVGDDSQEMELDLEETGDLEDRTDDNIT